MRCLSTLLALVVVSAASAGASGGRTLGGYGVSVSLPPGWHGVTSSGQLQAADFSLPRSALGSAQSVRVRPGHVHLIVWDYGPSVVYLSNFPPSGGPLSIRRRDLTGTPLEGFPSGHVFALRTVTLGEELLEVVVDFGPKPLVTGRLRELNRVLATLHVHPPRVLRPRAGRLTSDGVSVRLPAGWSGRLEVPPNLHATRLVLRARRGDIRLVLLELPGGQGRHLELPISLTSRDVFRRHRVLIARKVFATGGRSFDLSVAIATRRELGQVNRLLATVAVAPRPWTFHACDLSLRLPGTWSAAIKPRDRCYPVVILRGSGIRVVLTELRPGERAHGRVLLRSGRRFRVEVIPRTAERRADAVLDTLRAARRTRPRTDPVAMISTPAWGLAACGAVRELRGFCPRRIPLTRSRAWTLIFHAPTRRFPLALVELESGIVYGGFQEHVHRPPILGNTVVLGGRFMRLGANAFPGPRARRVAVRDGMANGLRRGPIALGPRTWAGLHGELSLTPTIYAAEGELADLVVFRWRDAAGDHAVGVNVWEPLTAAVATLRAIVSTLAPAPAGKRLRPEGIVAGIPMTSPPSWLAALCATPPMLRLACPTRVPAGTSEGAYVTIEPTPPSGKPKLSSISVSIEARAISARVVPRPPWHLELTAGFHSATRRFAHPRPIGRIKVPPGYLVTAPIPLGRRDWTSVPGSLVFGDCFGNHLCYRWRQDGRGYQIDLHAWDPVAQTARVLRAVVRSTPAGRS